MGKNPLRIQVGKSENYYMWPSFVLKMQNLLVETKIVFSKDKGTTKWQNYPL